MNKHTAGRSSHLQDSLVVFIRELPRGTHLTAPEVYRRARESGLNVSLSTVYRTLNHLQEHGHVQALAGEHGRRYESSDSGHEHDHLICVKCGLTIEFEDDLIHGFGRSVAERKRYAYRNSRFDILGICSRCKSTSSAHKIDSVLGSFEETISKAESLSQHCQRTAELLAAGKILDGKELLVSTIPLLKEIGKEMEKTISALQEELIQAPKTES